MSRAASRWAITLPLVVLAFAAAFALRQSDLSTPSPFRPQCLLHLGTGLHCPGCGNTRAAHALLHGDVVGAARQNLLLLLLLPFLAFFAFRSWMEWVYPGRLRPLPWKWRQPYTWGLVSVLLLFTLFRNLPWVPFSWLAPEAPAIKANPESADPARPPRDAPPREER